MVNPYGGQIYTIDLTPQKVDGFVFWTKNIGPFLKHLPAVREQGYSFLIQHTITGYPRELEFKVINSTYTVEHLKQVAAEYGPAGAIWRYDPIVFSSLTPLDWHRRNFEVLAKSLQGTTDEVVISFAQIYKKTKRNMNWATQAFNFDWHEHETVCQEQGRSLAIELAQIARTYRMQLKVCSQKAFLVPGLIEEARCVDANRLERVSGHMLTNRIKLKGNREECACFASRDIGAYDTCPHGCVYCYAVRQRDVALSRYKAHDPQDEFLFPPRHLRRCAPDFLE
ncbi:MAG: DUF1848 domain-containing protein [Ktedonobacteraceae bacterium]